MARPKAEEASHWERNTNSSKGAPRGFRSDQRWRRKKFQNVAWVSLLGREITKAHEYSAREGDASVLPARALKDL